MRSALKTSICSDSTTFLCDQQSKRPHTFRTDAPRNTAKPSQFLRVGYPIRGTQLLWGHKTERKSTLLVSDSSQQPHHHHPYLFHYPHIPLTTPHPTIIHHTGKAKKVEKEATEEAVPGLPPALTEAISQLTKKYGTHAVSFHGRNAAPVNVDVVPSGSLGLDFALGVGGIPKVRLGVGGWASNWKCRVGECCTTLKEPPPQWLLDYMYHVGLGRYSGRCFPTLHLTDFPHISSLVLPLHSVTLNDGSTAFWRSGSHLFFSYSFWGVSSCLVAGTNHGDLRSGSLWEDHASVALHC